MKLTRVVLNIFLVSSVATAAVAADKKLAEWSALSPSSLALNFSNKSAYSKSYRNAQANSSKAKPALVEKLRMALAAMKFDEPKQALAILPSDQNFKSAGLPVDFLILTRARAQYQAGQYKEAEASYSSVPQLSDYWVTAVEERAHTKGKAGEYNKALGDLTTLMSPVFEKNLGPEAYFTAALTYYRLCQFGKVFETLEKFKTNMKARALALNSVANREADEKVIQAIEQINKKGYTNVSYAKLAPELPTNFHLDFGVRASLSQPDAAVKKVAQLASKDLEEISRVIRQMHLIEAEVMQRLHIVEQKKNDNRGKVGKFKSGKDQMVFPYNGEVWLDEVDQYQVQSELCPKGKSEKRI